MILLPTEQEIKHEYDEIFGKVYDIYDEFTLFKGTHFNLISTIITEGIDDFLTKIIGEINELQIELIQYIKDIEYYSSMVEYDFLELSKKHIDKNKSIDLFKSIKEKSSKITKCFNKSYEIFCKMNELESQVYSYIEE